MTINPQVLSRCCSPIDAIISADWRRYLRAGLRLSPSGSMVSKPEERRFVASSAFPLGLHSPSWRPTPPPLPVLTVRELLPPPLDFPLFSPRFEDFQKGLPIQKRGFETRHATNTRKKRFRYSRRPFSTSGPSKISFRSGKLPRKVG